MFQSIYVILKNMYIKKYTIKHYQGAFYFHVTTVIIIIFILICFYFKILIPVCCENSDVCNH